MRELILKMSITLDGFVCGPDGEIDWVFDPDPAATAWTVETIANASLHIMGSRTFHDMVAFWPTSTAVFAPPMNGIPKAVFTRRDAAALQTPRTTTALLDARADAGDNASAVLQPGAESWTEAYVASAPLADEVAKLKAEDGKPIIAHGGAGFARSLIAENLVDRYALLVHPVVLGKGLAIFDGLAAVKRLQLVSATAFPKGAVAKVYRPL